MFRDKTLATAIAIKREDFVLIMLSGGVIVSLLV
jgi:hypothetical protein